MAETRAQSRGWAGKVSGLSEGSAGGYELQGQQGRQLGLASDVEACKDAKQRTAA